MTDITMCPGRECPYKEECYRYTADKDEFWQSFFVDIPYNIETKVCVYFSSNQRNKDNG